MVSGSNPSGIGPDEESTSLNEDGNMEVIRPSEKIIGDFENDLEKWNEGGDQGALAGRTSSGNQTGVYNGNYSYEFNNGSGGNATSYLYRDIDLTDLDEISVWVYFNRGEGVDEEISIVVGGQKEESIQASDVADEEWHKLIADVSDYEGSQELRIQFDTDDSTYPVCVDYIVWSKSPITRVEGAEGVSE